MLKLPLNKGLGLHLSCRSSSPLPWQAISLQPPFLSIRSCTGGERRPGETPGALSLEESREIGGGEHKFAARLQTMPWGEQLFTR